MAVSTLLKTFHCLGRIVGSRRWIFYFPKPDILLGDMDVLTKDERYLKPIIPEQFQDMNDALCIPITPMKGERIKKIGNNSSLVH